VRTDFVFFANGLTTRGTERRAALVAEAILQEEGRPTRWTLTTEFWGQDQVDILQIAFCFGS